MDQINPHHKALVSRPAEFNPQDCEAIARLLFGMYQEVGRGTLNPQKAWLNLCGAVEKYAAYMVFDGEMLVGSAGLVPLDLSYTDDPFFVDQWLYVVPEYRTGEAFCCLLDEIQGFSDSTGATVMLRVFNPKRAKVRDQVSRIGESFCITPAGADLEVSPKGREGR